MAVHHRIKTDRHILCFFFVAYLKMQRICVAHTALPSVHTACVSMKMTLSVKIISWKLNIWCRQLVKIASSVINALVASYLWCPRWELTVSGLLSFHVLQTVQLSVMRHIVLQDKMCDKPHWRNHWAFLSNYNHNIHLPNLILYLHSYIFFEIHIFSIQFTKK